MRKNKKGFTLVELVIVIAVIAILAGVMIAVFANVVNDAKESADLQEMKQAELQQKMEDITAKLENADWLSWEDIEVAIAEGLEGVDAGASTEEITAAIDNAIKEYADSLGSGNTGVTEEQIKYIIENSLSGQLTSAQVEAIVKRYQSDPTVSLSASQIAQIKEAASANSLTVAQIQQVVEAVGNDTYADVKAAIDAIVPNGGISSLTSEEVSSIVNNAMAQYVRNGVAGDYKWYTEEVEQKITSGQAVTLKLGGTAAGDEVAIDKDGFKAIAGLSAEQIRELEKGGSYELDLGDGTTVTLTASDLSINRAEKPGVTVATDHGITLALDTELTHELILEGIAREFVSRVQNLRKEAGLEVSDRIRLHYRSADAIVREAVEHFTDYISGETLATSIAEGDDPAALRSEEEDLNGHLTKIDLAK